MKKGLFNQNKVWIIVAIIIALAILGYGYMDYKYKKEVFNQKVKSELNVESEKVIKAGYLQNCLDEVNGRLKGTSFTGITEGAFKILIDVIQKQKDECFKKFPQ